MTYSNLIRLDDGHGSIPDKHEPIPFPTHIKSKLFKNLRIIHVNSTLQIFFSLVKKILLSQYASHNLVFSVQVFFSLKKDHTHTHTHVQQQQKKRRTKELEEKYKQWQTFSYRIHRTFLQTKKCPIIFIYSQRLAYPTEEKENKEQYFMLKKEIVFGFFCINNSQKICLE